MSNMTMLKNAVREYFRNKKQGYNVSDESFILVGYNNKITRIDEETEKMPSLSDFKNIVWINGDTISDKNYTNIVTNDELDILKETSYVGTHIDRNTLFVDDMEEYYTNFMLK